MNIPYLGILLDYVHLIIKLSEHLNKGVPILYVYMITSICVFACVFYAGKRKSIEHHRSKKRCYGYSCRLCTNTFMFLTGFWWISKNVIWIFFRLCVLLPSIRHTLSVCLSHKCRCMVEISRFLMFHCWSSQHCRLLISYFLFYFILCVLCVFEQKQQKRKKKNNA